MARKGGNGDPMNEGSYSGSTMPKGMDGSKGMSPRKAIAGAGMKDADTGTGGFGVCSFAEAQSHSGHHPDHVAGTGGNTLGDHERGIGHAIPHTRGHHPAQAAPHHGPHHPDGYGDHHNHGHRGGREARHRGG